MKKTFAHATRPRITIPVCIRVSLPLRKQSDPVYDCADLTKLATVSIALKPQFFAAALLESSIRI